MSIYEFNSDDAYRFAHEQNIKVLKKGDELHFWTCPYCHGGGHHDTNTFSINLRTGQFKCMRNGCGIQGNMITLAKDFGFSLGTQVDEYFNPKRRYRDLSNYPRPITRTPAVEYMESRGISRIITEKYGLTTSKDDDHILMFPFFDECGKMQFIKYRKTNFVKGKDKNKEWCQADCKPILFGMDQCNPQAGPLVLTEGQIDSLSVAEAGIPNAVSVPTGAKGFTWVPYCWDFLNQFDTLIVFGDHEKGHITLLDEMAARFHGTVKHVREEDYKDCKDANELLQKYKVNAVRDAVRNAVPVRHPRIKSLAEVEKKDMSLMEVMSTGFGSLDKLIGGFYFGNLVILTGERGKGKSTLASQFVIRAIQQGYTTFCYSGELRDWFFQDWFDRQCAGRNNITAKKSHNGFQNYLVNPEVIAPIHNWYGNQCFLYDNTIMLEAEDENEQLIKIIEIAIMQYSCRVIMVDNLMTAMDDNFGVDIYRQQTAFIKKLAVIAKKYNVLILLIAHPRKKNGYKFQNDDVAGSSNITNLADLVLYYDEPDEGDQKSDRALEILKDRISGRYNGSKIPLWFDEASKRITDVEGEFDWMYGWQVSKAAFSADGFAPIDDEEIPF